MSKTVKIIIGILVALFIAGVVAFFLLPQTPGAPGDQPSFGEGGDRGGDGFGRDGGGFEGGGFLNGGQAGDSGRLPQLFQIHENAVAGAGVFARPRGEEGDGVDVISRYIERGVGNIFETNLGTLDKKTISNETRLRIYEALWGKDGKDVLIRYLDETNNAIRSFLIQIEDGVVGAGGFISTQGEFLPENITEVALSNNKERLFYLLTINNAAVGTIYRNLNGSQSQIFSSPLSEWLPQWPTDDTITLTTKPSGIVNGVMYSLDVDTERITKVLGGVRGLTTLTSPAGNKVLYAETFKSSISLSLYNTEDRQSVLLPFGTLPEKCVWASDAITVYCAVPNSVPTGIYPDDWYQGTMSFSDDIWRVNTETFVASRVISFQNITRQELDGIRLMLDPTDSVLIFQNKKDLSLWGLYPNGAPRVSPPQETNLDG